jgi:hypothetical protein
VAVPPEPCPDANRVGRTIYGLQNGLGNGRIEVKHTGPGETRVYGTIVVEGNGPPEDCSGGGADLRLGSQTRVYTAANAYGYPLVALIYDPQQPAPTATTRQETCADLGASGGNTLIYGIVYSGGKVEFNPLALNGGVVAYDVETQGSAEYTYNSTYGNAAPPPGFAADSGANVVILRKSFITCSSISANASGHDFNNPSRCN